VNFVQRRFGSKLAIQKESGMGMSNKFELSASALRLICEPKVFKFKNTSEVRPLDTVIGQERAVEAIDFGLNMQDPGYNIFVTGLAGTGKSTIVRDLVNKHARNLPQRPVPGQ